MCALDFRYLEIRCNAADVPYMTASTKFHWRILGYGVWSSLYQRRAELAKRCQIFHQQPTAREGHDGSSLLSSLPMIALCQAIPDM